MSSHFSWTGESQRMRNAQVDNIWDAICHGLHEWSNNYGNKQESVVTTYSDCKRLTNKYSLQICLNIRCPLHSLLEFRDF